MNRTLRIVTALLLVSTFAASNVSSWSICVSGNAPPQSEAVCKAGQSILPSFGIKRGSCVSTGPDGGSPDLAVCAAVEDANICVDFYCESAGLHRQACVNDTDGGSHCLRVNA